MSKLEVNTKKLEDLFKEWRGNGKSMERIYTKPAMTIETPTLRHVVHTYEVFAEFEGHEYRIAVLVKRERSRTTYRQILVETSKRKWFGTVQMPERLRRYVEKEVRKKHFQQK